MIASKLVFPIVLLAAGLSLAASPVQKVPDIKWDPLTTNPAFKIDLDPDSVKVLVIDGGFEVKTRLKMSFGQPIEVKGKKKIGAYYVNDLAAVCKDDVVKIDKSTVYSAEGEVLAVGSNLGAFTNPHISTHFVTIWMGLSCNDLKGKSPGKTT